VDEIRYTEESLFLYRQINSTSAPYPSQSSIKQLFERCAEDFGDKVAVSYRDAKVSYRELNRRANKLAVGLRRAGVNPGSAVGIYMNREIGLIVALIAIAKCGAVYLPFDSSWPEERLQGIFDDAECEYLLVNGPEDLASRFPRCQVIQFDQITAGAAEANPPNLATAEEIAYINFTSGTTGRPKGVAIQHRSIARLVSSSSYARLDDRVVLLNLSPLTFDAATFEIWGALLNGGTCVLYPSAAIRLSELRQVLQEQGVTVLFLTTALFNAIVDEAPETLASVPCILTGGERCSESHVARALEYYGAGRMVHVYGPTECTTFATFHPVGPASLTQGTLPIGRPIQNTRLYLVSDGSLCRPGEAGEILIAGPGLSPGYLGSPQSSHEKFVDYDIGGVRERVYRTGDYGYLLDNGDLMFQGRVDDQVKISGFRIELAEVSLAIDRHPGVRQSYVTVGEAAAGERTLLAFVTFNDDELTAKSLRDYLRLHLPGYMVPSRVYVCARLPLQANGKVDREALLSAYHGAGDASMTR
jgi:D-alanine--poly(phosphoribitol) ligase subunit 1